MREFKEGENVLHDFGKRYTHDNRKTTYYDNAVIKIYNIPIFTFHFYLILILQLKEERFITTYTFDSKNLGAGVTIPFFGQ